MYSQKDGARGFFRCSATTEGNEGVGFGLGSFGWSRGSRNTKSNLLAVNFNGHTGLFRSGQAMEFNNSSYKWSPFKARIWSLPGVNQTKGDSVGTNTERTPLLGDGLCETNNSRLRSSVVGLANISVQARGGGDIDDGAVLTLFGLIQRSMSPCPQRQY